MKAADAPEVIAKLAQAQKLKGLRPILQGLGDPIWIDDPALDPAMETMLSHGLVFDALVLQPHLASIEAFARCHPDLPVVIDHAGKPRIAEGHYRDWRLAMQRLAAMDNVCCKLSGPLTEAGDQRPQAVRSYAETILELLGPKRVIRGSNWPVVNLAQDYSAWIEQCLSIVPSDDHAAVFGGNVCRFYRL